MGEIDPPPPHPPPPPGKITLKKLSLIRVKKAKV